MLSFKRLRRTLQTFKNLGKYNKVGESQTQCSTVALSLKYIFTVSNLAIAQD